MPLYTISLLNPDGGVVGRDQLHARDDDQIAEIVGWLRHPHGIDVHHAERHVMRVPPGD